MPRKPKIEAPKFELATAEEATELLAKTRGWVKNHTMFHNAQGTAAAAAAEYVLNMQGKTLYEHLTKDRGVEHV